MALLCLCPATWWSLFSLEVRGNRQRCLSLSLSLSLSACVCVRRLTHWTDFSFCTGVQKGNSSYRMRPGYSKFLHFIASSPQQDTLCEAGLRWFEVESTPPIWNQCQSSQEDLCSLGCLQVFMWRWLSHFGIVSFFLCKDKKKKSEQKPKEPVSRKWVSYLSPGELILHYSPGCWWLTTYSLFFIRASNLMVNIWFCWSYLLAVYRLLLNINSVFENRFQDITGFIIGYIIWINFKLNASELDQASSGPSKTKTVIPDSKTKLTQSIGTVTILHTAVQSNAIQYNSSAINSTFTKFIMFGFCWLCLKCVNSATCFSSELTVSGAVVLDCIILYTIIYIVECF